MGKNKPQAAPATTAPTPAADAAPAEEAKEPKPDPVLVAAQAAHEANRAYCQSIGDDSQAAWADAPEWQKESAIKGVVFAIDNNFPSPEAMHDSWATEKLNAGWTWGPVKDADKKTHPCLVGYPLLPIEQRKKDDIFLATIKKSLEDSGVFKPDNGGLQSTEVWLAAQEADEDAKGLVAHMGPTIYETEWNACLTLAFKGTRRDILTDWGAVPFELASFVVSNPTAPVDAALIHVKRTLKIAVLPNEDPRRVLLALRLFKCWLDGRNAIDREDGEALRRTEEAKAASRGVSPHGDAEGGPFDMEQGGLAAPSDFALKK